MKKLRGIVKIHGGKYFVANWLRDNLPKDIEKMHYIEGCAGAGNVLLNKPLSRKETINDLNTDLIALWIVFQSHHERFLDELKRWDYSAENFQRALDMVVPEEIPDDLDELMNKAIREYVLCRMSRGGLKRSFGWADRPRGGKPGDVNAWETMFGQIPRINQRVKNISIFNKNVFDLMKELDSKDSFFYLDPPYVKSTRSRGSTEVYKHEMSDKDHEKLLELCRENQGKIMISGYQCPLYLNKLKDWDFKYMPVPNHSCQNDKKPIKLECIWRNYSTYSHKID